MNQREQMNRATEEEIMTQQAVGGVPRDYLRSNEDLIETTKFGKLLTRLRKQLLLEKYNPKTGKYETDEKNSLMNSRGIESNIGLLRFIANQIISLGSIRETKMYELFHSVADTLSIYNWLHWQEFKINPKTYCAICDLMNVLIMAILTHPVTNTPISDKEFLRGTTDERHVKLERIGEGGGRGFSLPSFGFRR